MGWRDEIEQLDLSGLAEKGDATPSDNIAPPDSLAEKVWEKARSMFPLPSQDAVEMRTCLNRALSANLPNSLISDPFMVQQVWVSLIYAFRIGVAYKELKEGGR